MAKSTDTNVSIPSWLNNDLLSEVLSKENETEVTVTDFSAEAAVPKGNNYLSTLYRIVAQYQDKNQENNVKKYFLILKALPEGDYMKVLSEMKGFEKEECMYKIVFPFIYKTMKSVTGRIHPFSAKCLPCPVETTLILEDLQHLGYKMANRREGLDLDHCKVVVRNYGRFHAYSLQLYKSDPHIMENFQEMIFPKSENKREELQSYVEIHLNTFVSELKKWPGFEHYAEKVAQLIPKGVDALVNSVCPKEDSLSVLNHGDCWTNNIMFHYSPETGKVDDVRFVDFQAARFTSPVVDLQYFMCICPDDEVRFDHRDTLLEEYHSEFCKTLTTLNLDPNILTLQQLKDEFAERDVFGLYMACIVLVALVADQEDTPDTTEVKEDPIKEVGEKLLSAAYAGKRYKQLMQKLLPFYEKKGLL